MEDERAEAWRAEQSAGGYDIETLAMDVASPDACSIALTKLLEDRNPITEEIAGAVAYLVEEEAGYITGANLPVNGGLYMS
jgi:acetoacetyl-CoA reductase